MDLSHNCSQHGESQKYVRSILVELLAPGNYQADIFLMDLVVVFLKNVFVYYIYEGVTDIYEGVTDIYEGVTHIIFNY